MNRVTSRNESSLSRPIGCQPTSSSSSVAAGSPNTLLPSPRKNRVLKRRGGGGGGGAPPAAGRQPLPPPPPRPGGADAGPAARPIRTRASSQVSRSAARAERASLGPSASVPDSTLQA